jgi:hypothetical protein
VTLSQTGISIKVFIPDCPMWRQRIACALAPLLVADKNSALNKVRDIALRGVLRIGRARCLINAQTGQVDSPVWPLLNLTVVKMAYKTCPALII